MLKALDKSFSDLSDIGMNTENNSQINTSQEDCYSSLSSPKRRAIIKERSSENCNVRLDHMKRIENNSGKLFMKSSSSFKVHHKETNDLIPDWVDEENDVETLVLF